MKPMTTRSSFRTMEEAAAYAKAITKYSHITGVKVLSIEHLGNKYVITTG